MIPDHGNDNLPKPQSKSLLRSRNWKADIDWVIEPITLPGYDLKNALTNHFKALILPDLEKVQTPKNKILYAAFAAKMPSFAEFEAQKRDLEVSALEGHLVLQFGGQAYGTTLRKQFSQSQGVTWHPIFEGLGSDALYRSFLRGEPSGDNDNGDNDNDKVLIHVFGDLKKNNELKKKVTIEITIV